MRTTIYICDCCAGKGDLRTLRTVFRSNDFSKNIDVSFAVEVSTGEEPMHLCKACTTLALNKLHDANK